MVDSDVQITLMLPTKAEGVHAGERSLLAALQKGRLHLFWLGY